MQLLRDAEALHLLALSRASLFDTSTLNNSEPKVTDFGACPFGGLPNDFLDHAISKVTDFGVCPFENLPIDFLDDWNPMRLTSVYVLCETHLSNFFFSSPAANTDLIDLFDRPGWALLASRSQLYSVYD